MTINAFHWDYPPFHWDNPTKSIVGIDPLTAAENTAYIQALLNTGGYIKFTTNDTYEINAALEIKSDTYLDLGAATIKQADSSDDNMMRTSAYNATKTSVSSLVWVTGTATATTATVHGLVPGDFVAIIGATISGYGGVHEVLTVADTTHFTYAVPDIGTSPSTGTITCVKANENITIAGGTWDYNEANQSTVGVAEAFGHILAYVNNLRVTNTDYYNTEKFCFFGFGLSNFVFDNIYFETVSDGIHLDGPIRNGNISRINGFTGDDGVVLMAQEDAASFAYAALSEGDVLGITVDGVNIESTTTVMTCYTPFGTAYTYDGILIKNINGKAPTPVKIAAISGSANYAKSIVIDGVSAQPTADAAMIRIINDAQVRSLVLKNFAHNKPTDQNIAINVLSPCIIDSLIIENVSVPDGWNSDGTNAAFAIFTQSGSTVGSLVVKDCNISVGSSGRKVTFMECNHTGDIVRVQNCGMTAGLKFVTLPALSSIDTIMMQNIYTSNVIDCLSITGNSMDVVVDGWIATDTSANDGLNFSFVGETVNLYAKGMLPRGSINMINLAAGTLNIYAPDFTWDVNDFNSAQVGQMCIHDGTARGTMVAGSCGNTGGTWFNLSDPLNDTWTP